MSLLVTGGNGFVMSNFVRSWLDTHADDVVTVLDRDRPDREVLQFLGDAWKRIHWVRHDITDRSWHAEVGRRGIDRIVHGAAVTPHPWIDNDGIAHDPESEAPEAAFDVNLGGTLAILAFARGLPGLRRIVMIATASIYRQAGDAKAVDENAPVAPDTLYGISKYAAELAARRYRSLYELPLVVARLGAVFGPMDRYLSSRHVVCAPNQAITLALSGETIRPDHPDGVGDWIHAADVAAALCALVSAAAPKHAIYNIASGRAETLARLCDLVTAALPGSRRKPGSATNLMADDGRRLGHWGGYDSGRLAAEFGWSPLPLEQRLADYIAWRRAHAPDTRMN